ncbi:uncharacterized protein EI90DRAFT_3077375, partial [Cantharellus anzutake]|uniref:uncharacterized protein n=1 Tax=Cantharellus anzutake TaxID=1750568 RepID=UPI001904C7F4
DLLCALSTTYRCSCSTFSFQYRPSCCTVSCKPEACRSLDAALPPVWGRPPVRSSCVSI